MEFLDNYNYYVLPKDISKRDTNKIYLFRKIKVKWNGKRLICLHDKIPSKCIECYGSQIYPHNKNKRFCKICKGSMICIHDKNKDYCSICDGKFLCLHNRKKYNC